MLLFAPSFGRILLTPHLFVTVPSSYRRGCLRSLSLFLSSFLFLSRSIPAVVPSCVMLRSSLPYSPSRHADLFPSPVVDSILPHPRSSVCRSLSAAAGRRIERKRTRTGPKQPPVNRDRFPLSPPFVFRRASASSFLPSSSPFLRSPGKLYNAKCYPCVALFGSLFLHLPSSSLFIFPVVARGPTFFRGSRFLFRSLLLPRNSFPRAVHSNSSLRKRFIDRHSRLFFLRAFSRLLELFSRV